MVVSRLLPVELVQDTARPVSASSGRTPVVGVDNRLTADQLAALTPGDFVTIESGAEFSRRKYRSGQVVRLDPSYVVVSAPGPGVGRSSSATAGGTASALEVSTVPSWSTQIRQGWSSRKRDAVPSTSTASSASGRGTGRNRPAPPVTQSD